MNDIQPTMDDSQVMDFVSRGAVVLEGVVSDEFNRQCETLPGGSINEYACSPGFRKKCFYTRKSLASLAPCSDRISSCR